MITSTSRIIGETLENLKNEKMLFLSTLTTMTVIFLVLNFFMAYTINLKGVNNFIKSNMQLKVYLDDGLTEDGIKNLEKSLMKYKEIGSTKYVSKEVALKQMVQNLQLDFEFSDNPLPNILILNIEEGVDISAFITKLKSEPGVKDIDAKVEFITNLNKLIKTINTITIYIYIMIAIPVFIMIFNLIGHSISRRREDIEVMSLVGASAWYIKWPFILEGFIHVILASAISTLIFIPIYDFFRTSVETIMPFLTLVSLKEIIEIIPLSIAGFGIIITFIASYTAIKTNLRMYGD